MNIVCLSGNITKDLELRSTQSGKQVLSFSLAINEGKDKTEFVNCQAWKKTAELIAQYCNKGDRLSLSGRLQTRKEETESGTKYYTEVVVNQFDFPPKGRIEKDASGYQEAKTAAQVGDGLGDEIPF